MNRLDNSRRDFLKISSVFAVSSLAFSTGVASSRFVSPDQIAQQREEKTKPLPHASPSKLPRWRGFNLLEKFNGSNKPFREDDFRNISELGFNFVRLPMDYRSWIVGNDKRKFNEQTLSEIDEAIEYGQKYGIHVHINFHRAPGYTVANPPESPLVWYDEETLDICKLHWQTFAKRYRTISGDQLSFNLFNEPAGCTESEYFKVAQTLVDAIRQESPQRLILCDGIDWGTKPCLSFKDLKVAQATRGYSPMEVSHYGASWVNSKDFPEPSWPFTSFNGLLPSPNKQELSKEVRKPITIQGPFSKDSKLIIRLGVVSNKAEIVVKFDDSEVFRQTFIPQGGKGEWKEAVFVEKYGVYQNLYDLDISLEIPDDTQTISIANVNGDWATINKLTISSGSQNAVSSGSADWNAQSPTELRYIDANSHPTIVGGTVRNRQWLWDNNVRPWKEAEKHGIGVMVGEFGAHNVTLHQVVLSWIEDMLINWQKADWGWALWNFRGSFGVADSGRKDVDYEEWRGLKLDRKLLSLLQRY